MRCPKCGGDTNVIESRKPKDQNSVRRRRECVKCGFRYTTHEYSDFFLSKMAQMTREAYGHG